MFIISVFYLSTGQNYFKFPFRASYESDTTVGVIRLLFLNPAFLRDAGGFPFRAMARIAE